MDSCNAGSWSIRGSLIIAFRLFTASQLAVLLIKILGSIGIATEWDGGKPTNSDLAERESPDEMNSAMLAASPAGMGN